MNRTPPSPPPIVVPRPWAVTKKRAIGYSVYLTDGWSKYGLQEAGARAIHPWWRPTRALAERTAQRHLKIWRARRTAHGYIEDEG